MPPSVSGGMTCGTAPETHGQVTGDQLREIDCGRDGARIEQNHITPNRR